MRRLGFALVLFLSGRAHAAPACSLLASNPLIIESESRAIFAAADGAGCSAVAMNSTVLLVPSATEPALPKTLTLYARVTYVGGIGLVLNVFNIPALATGPEQRRFDVKVGGNTAAVLFVRVQEVRAHPSLEVELGTATQSLAQLPSGGAAHFSKLSGISRPTARVSYSGSKITAVNRVALETPPEFYDRVDGTGASFVWRIESTSWSGLISFPGCVGASAIETLTSYKAVDSALASATLAASEDCYVHSSALRFTVSAPTTRALSISLALVRITGTGPAPVAADTLWRGSVEVASGATGSIPIPAARYFKIECDGVSWTVKNGGVLAIDDSAMQDRRCSVKFTPDDSIKDEAALIQNYGEQLVSVAVARDGTKDVAPQPWLIDEVSLRVGYRLVAPPDDASGHGPYHVRLLVMAQRDVAALYAHPEGESTTGTDTSLEFVATLAPRGPFGFPGQKSVRVFFTVPVDIVAVRIPASVKDLRSSTEITSVQPLFIKTGLLLALEPWDYRYGKNLSPLPVRVAAGVHLLGVGTGGVGGFLPSFIAGVYFTLPLVSSVSQVNTSLALGALYELDLRDRRSYALLSLGFNVFSFLGANK